MIPLGAFDDDLSGIASEMKAEPACVLLTMPFGEVGLGDSAREERRLSRGGDSLKLFDEVRGDGFGRPSLLAEFRPKVGNPMLPLLEGDGARANPPWTL